MSKQINSRAVGTDNAVPVDEAMALGVAGLEHDFRNLLQCGLSASRLVVAALEGRQTQAEGKRQMTRIAREGMNALEKAAAVSRWIRPTSPARDRIVDIDVQQIFAGLRGLLELAVGENIHLTIRLADKLPALRCDPIELENVLLNLIVNGRQAIADRGCIVLSGETVQDEGFDHVRFTVADTGSGIARETLRYLSHSACTTKQDGSGFGLARARSFAEALGGSLTLENAPFVGARVSLSIPVPLSSRLRPNGQQAPSNLS